MHPDAADSEGRKLIWDMRELGDICPPSEEEKRKAKSVVGGDDNRKKI
jgi:hypothetical protein